MVRRCLIAGLAVEAAILVGCRDSSSRRTNGGPAPGTLTFTRDVAPIFFQECVACHRPGESAPFSLLTYREARQRARTIVSVTQSRFMPPWLPDQGYGEFAGERRLTDTHRERSKGTPPICRLGRSSLKGGDSANRTS